MANMQVTVVDGNNVTVSLDRGVAGVGIASVQLVVINQANYLLITYTNGTTQTVGPVGVIQYSGTSPININGSVISLTTVPVNLGGTGQTTANAGLNALLPVQTSHANKYLQTDGTNSSWDAISLSTADITGILPVVNGGTGVSTSTGSGNTVLSTSPTLVTPALGTPASGVMTNVTGTAAGLTAGNVTTNANLTGDVTSVGNATSIAAGVIVNADINASAAIDDTKLATIATASKVSNSATTAASANTANAIVARDASGNFTAGTVTAALTGNSSTTTALATGRTIAITGDLAYTSPSFDGSGNVTAAGTLATVATAGVTGSSTAIPVVTINAKGLTTSITTAAVIAPAGTLSGSTLAAGVTGSSLTSLGTIANLSVTAGTISTTPSASTDIANKDYVDTVAQGLDPKASCVAATTANITLSGTQTIDGVALIAADRCLVKDQTAPAENGIYVVASGAWTRSTDMNVWLEVPGAFTFIEQGTAYADTGWVCTSNAGGTLGTTPITWVQFAGVGSYTAGTGLTLTGTAFSLTAPVTVALGGTNATSAGIASFNNITGYTAAGATGTTSTNLVFSTSPTLVTPILGTPQSATLTNATGLPLTTGVTGTLPVANGGTGITSFGTGVATALGVNVGTAGAFVVNGGALGTPSSGTVTNLTGTASININGTVGATTPTTGAFTTLTDTGLTSGRVTFASTGGLLVDSANMTFNGNSLTVSGGVSLTTNAAKFQSTYSGVTTTNLFTDSGGGVISVDGSNTISLRTGGISGTSVAVVSSTGLAVTGTLSATSSSTQEIATFAHPSTSTTANNGGAIIRIQNTSSTNGNMQSLQFNNASGSASSAIFGYNTDQSTHEGFITFGTRNSAGTFGERARIDSSGNLGIGTTSPAQKLDVGATSDVGISMNNSTSVTSGNRGTIYMLNSANSTVGFIRFGAVTDNSGTDIQFAVRPAGGSLNSTAMKLDSSGNLLVGTTTAGAGAGFPSRIAVDAGAGDVCIFKTSDSTNAFPIRAWNSGTTGDNVWVNFATETSYTSRGSITYNRTGGLIVYGTTSDYRAKDINGPVTNSGALIDSIPVYMGKMKWATQERPMFIAHEVPAYAHTGEKDAVDKDGKPVYQQMDAAALIPVMWAELQSLRARVAQLESKP